MKKTLCLFILLYTVYAPILAEDNSLGNPDSSNSINISLTSLLLYDLPFPISIMTTDEEEPTSPPKTRNNPLPHITFTYIVPITYMTFSIVCKEVLYTENPEDNPLLYVNPVVTSILTFGSAGFFVGLTIGLLSAKDDGFIESFVYATIVGALLGLTGMITGGIYSFIEYDTIIENDLFYYGGPAFYLLIPVVEIIQILIDD